jgi:hypothetical protein
MNKRTKYIYNGAISIVATFFVVIFLRGCIYSHKHENNPQRYLWLFADSIKSSVNNYFSTGHIRENDIHYYYKYNKTYITILEFKELSFIKAAKVPFELNVDFSNFKDKFTGETFNLDVLPIPEISINFKLPFHNSFRVNLDNNSQIIKWIEGKNYRGFFGNIFKMSFSNAQGEDLVLFNYKREATPTLFLIYKYEGRFIVIVINSDNTFDESIINILNLKTI